LVAHVELQVGLDVGEEQDLGLLAGVGQLGLEVAEHVELCVERVADVHVPLVLARPEEGLATLDVLDVVGVHAARVEHLVLGLAEVVADRADDAHVAEERRGQGEVHGGAAEHALAIPEGSLHRVEGDRSNHNHAHAVAEASR
jgi:hypothetical protein